LIQGGGGSVTSVDAKRVASPHEKSDNRKKRVVGKKEMQSRAGSAQPSSSTGRKEERYDKDQTVGESCTLPTTTSQGTRDRVATMEEENLGHKITEVGKKNRMFCEYPGWGSRGRLSNRGGRGVVGSQEFRALLFFSLYSRTGRI